MTDINKEILKYSSAAAALLAATHGRAQHKYTNIDDTTIAVNNGFYNLDLDQDGTADFTIRQYVDTGLAGTTNAVLIQPILNSGNRVVGEKVGQYNYPFNLQAATLVGVDSEWEGAGGQFNTGYLAFEVDGQAYPNSNWVGPIQDGYLGLQIWKNNKKHYGWARLDIADSSDAFTLKDFAVNLTPDSAIVVGFELLGEVENLLEQVGIAVHASGIELSKPAEIRELRFTLRDSNGKLLHKGTLIDSIAIITTEGLPVGIYILELGTAVLSRTEKLFIY